jgi:hypothetical protein
VYSYISLLTTPEIVGDPDASPTSCSFHGSLGDYRTYILRAWIFCVGSSLSFCCCLVSLPENRADDRPDPSPDANFELPLLTSLLNVKMPDSTEAPQVRKTLPAGPDRPRPVCISDFHEADIRSWPPCLTRPLCGHLQPSYRHCGRYGNA